MAFEENDNKAELKRIEGQIASTDLATRADALAEMVHFLSNELERPGKDRLPYILAAIDLNLELKRDAELAGNYWSLSDAFYEQKRLDESIQALENSIESARASGDESSLPMTMNNLGNIYYEKDDMGAAITWYERGLEVSREQNRNVQATQALMRLTRILLGEEKWDEALQYATDAYEIFKGDDNTFGMVDAKLQIVWNYLLRGDVENYDAGETLAHIASILELVNQPHLAEAHQVLTCWYQIDSGASNPGTIDTLDALLRESRNRNDAIASTVFNFVRAKFFTYHGDYRQAIVLLKSLLNSGESIDTRIKKSMLFFELFLAQQFAGEHFDAAQTAIEFAAHAQSKQDSESEFTCYGWAGEQYLEAGNPELAVGYLEKHHAENFGSNILDDYEPGTRLARAYLQLARHTEALIIVNDLDARIGIFTGSVAATDTVEPAESALPKNWLAQLHELKLDILMAMGDSEHAETEGQLCKQEYEAIEDFASVSRVYKSLRAMSSSGLFSRRVEEPVLFQTPTTLH